MEPERPRLVNFNGTNYWLRPSGALAHLSHCDDTGELTREGLFEVSYAHLFEDGVIRRFNRRIGVAADLKDVHLLEADNAD